MKLSSLEILASLNLTTEQLAGVTKVLSAEIAPLEATREKSAARQLRYRHRHGNVRIPLISERNDDVEITSLARVEDNTLPSFTSGKEVKEENKPPHKPPTSSKPLPSDEPEGFVEFREVYPTRDGSADWKGARKAYVAALRRASQLTILEGVTLFAAAMIERGKIGTEFIPQARTWLNGDRWNERYSAPPATAKPNGIQDGFAKVRAVIDEIERREAPGNGTASPEDDLGISRL